MRAVELTRVKKSYGEGQNTVHALRDITVSFEQGTFTAIMGPSGSGKTTLLQCAAGLERPTEGSVKIASKNVARWSETKLTLLRRDSIGFIFQSFNLMPSLTAFQNVALPLQLAGKKPDSKLVNDALEQVGLGDRAHHLPSQLSGGQQQRVAIARALATRPQVLFADEPTGALDSNTGKDVMKLICSLVSDQKQTVVMVTHDPNIAAYADTVIFLVDGRLNGTLKAPKPEAIAGRMASLER